MSNISDGKIAQVLKALLEGRKLNRKDFNNGSLHSWISTLRNKKHIPVASSKNTDGTCDYFMLPEEIKRYKDPVLRAQQRDEVRAAVERERQVKLIEDFLRFLARLVEFPVLWSFWCEAPFKLSEISTEINALLVQEESVNQ